MCTDALVISSHNEYSLETFGEAAANISSRTYNQATTNLAFHSNETSKDKLSIIKHCPSIIVIHGSTLIKLHKNVFISTCSITR